MIDISFEISYGFGISKAFSCLFIYESVQFSCSVMCDTLRPHGLQHARLPVHHQFLEFTQLMSIRLMMPSDHLILCHPLLPPSIFSSIRIFSNESVLRIRVQSIGVSAPASAIPMITQDWFPLGWTGWIALQSKGLSRVFSNTTVQKHQFFGTQPSSQSNSHIHTWPQEKP